MRRAVVLLVLLAGCSGGRAEIPDSPGTVRRVTEIESGEGTTYTVVQNIETNVRNAQIPWPADAAWGELPEVYEELGVPVTTVNPQTRLIGTQEKRVRRIGDARPSRYLECGAGIAGQYADLYDVFLTVMTQVEPGANGVTVVRTQVEAAAKDAGHGNNPIRCSSKGSLERAIVDGINRRLGQKG